MPDHPYYRASRYADASMGEHGDLEKWAAHHGVELPNLIHLSQQRALRAVMTQFMGVDPGAMNLSLSDERVVAVPKDLLALMPLLQSMFIDGWAANNHYHEGNDHV